MLITCWLDVNLYWHWAGHELHKPFSQMLTWVVWVNPHPGESYLHHWNYDGPPTHRCHQFQWFQGDTPKRYHLRHPKVNLVGGWATPLKNISQLGWLFPIYGKINNVPNHQPGITWVCKTSGSSKLADMETRNANCQPRIQKPSIMISGY